MSFVADDSSFQATFSSGNCSECGDPLLKGEWLVYVADELVHEECASGGGSWTNTDKMPWD